MRAHRGWFRASGTSSSNSPCAFPDRKPSARPFRDYGFLCPESYRRQGLQVFGIAVSPRPAFKGPGCDPAIPSYGYLGNQSLGHTSPGLGKVALTVYLRFPSLRAYRRGDQVTLAWRSAYQFIAASVRLVVIARRGHACDLWSARASNRGYFSVVWATPEHSAGGFTHKLKAGAIEALCRWLILQGGGRI